MERRCGNGPFVVDFKGLRRFIVLRSGEKAASFGGNLFDPFALPLLFCDFFFLFLGKSWLFL